MIFDLQILENLLHQPEGTGLDFKEEQYAFEDADIGKKAELLKDILALANSWRMTTAYILIGVREIKGARSEVVGVEEHLDDANLHQFVNGKTQRPVEFSCFPFLTEGKAIDVIEIPKQQRPIFVTSRYGQIKASEVPVRDGSSTRPATPDEIARMGAEQVAGGAPQFTLEWANVAERIILSRSQKLHSLRLDPLFPDDTFAPRRSPRMFESIDLYANPRYSKELISYAFAQNFFKPLGFCLENKSSMPGKRVQFTGRLAKLKGLSIREWLEKPPSPTRDFMGSRITPPILLNEHSIAVDIRELQDRWEIIIDFGDVRPRDQVWTNDSIYIASSETCTATLQGELRADNLPDPIKCGLEVKIEPECRPMHVEDVLPFLRTERP